MNVDSEIDYVKYIPSQKSSQYILNDYSNASSQIIKMNLYNKNSSQSNFNNSFSDNNNDKNTEYYNYNIGGSENNYNEIDYCINENQNDNIIYENNNIIIKKSPCGRWKSNKSFYSAPKREQNFTNSSNNKIIKVRTIKENIQNFGNNNYNNNIYYINPINIKKNFSNAHKSKKKNNEKKRSFEYTFHRKNKNNEKDYFRMKNIDKNQKKDYIEAATLIQSVFRGYSLKMKFYKLLYFNDCINKGIVILQNILLKKKKVYWNLLEKNIPKNITENSSELRTPYLSFKLKSKFRKNYLSSYMSNSYYNDVDTFHNSMKNEIKTDDRDSECNSKINNIIKENNQLKIQLYDYQKMEEQLKQLKEENKKYQSINDIIMKHNNYLEKKIKDIQGNKNKNLVIEKQSHLFLSQKDNSNEMYLSKLKKFISAKLVYKKINNKNTSMEEKKNKLGNIAKKEIYMKSIIYIIEKHIKLKLNKYFWRLYKYSQIEKEKKMKAFLLYNKLQSILYNKEIRKEEIVNEDSKCTIKDNEISEDLKYEKLKKIFSNYEKNVKLIYKVNFEKWFLKAIIIGIRESARDKKKKRKQKKKINKIIYNKYFELTGKNNNINNIDVKFSENLNFFKNISSEGSVLTKEPLSVSCKKIENNVYNSSTCRTTNLINNEDIKENVKNIRTKYKALNRRYINDKDSA